MPSTGPAGCRAAGWGGSPCGSRSRGRRRAGCGRSPVDDPDLETAEPLPLVAMGGPSQHDRPGGLGRTGDSSQLSDPAIRPKSRSESAAAEGERADEGVADGEDVGEGAASAEGGTSSP